MATPTQGPSTSPVPVPVEIHRPPSAKPPIFWVSVKNNEEVVWHCMQSHQHGNGKCFTIEFAGESPFANHIFHDHLAHSGLPVVPPDEHKLYKYNVTIPGELPLDPQGGVKG